MCHEQDFVNARDPNQVLGILTFSDTDDRCVHAHDAWGTYSSTFLGARPRGSLAKEAVRQGMTAAQFGSRFRVGRVVGPSRPVSHVGPCPVSEAPPYVLRLRGIKAPRQSVSAQLDVLRRRKLKPIRVREQNGPAR
jgi:hypothetical protein